MEDKTAKLKKQLNAIFLERFKGKIGVISRSGIIATLANSESPIKKYERTNSKEIKGLSCKRYTSPIAKTPLSFINSRNEMDDFNEITKKIEASQIIADQTKAKESLSVNIRNLLEKKSNLNINAKEPQERTSEERFFINKNLNSQSHLSHRNHIKHSTTSSGRGKNTKSILKEWYKNQIEKTEKKLRKYIAEYMIYERKGKYELPPVSPETNLLQKKCIRNSYKHLRSQIIKEVKVKGCENIILSPEKKGMIEEFPEEIATERNNNVQRSKSFIRKY